MTIRTLREQLSNDEQIIRFKVLDSKTNRTLTNFKNRSYKGNLMLNSRYDDAIVKEYKVFYNSYVEVKVYPRKFDRNK